MSTRRYVVGCTVTAVALLLLIVIGAVVTFRRLSAPVPLAEASRLAAEDSVGHAVLRIEPDNPWVRQMFIEMSKYSTHETPTSEIFPIELVWSAHRLAPASEGHMLDLSFSPRGRFFGVMTDLMLWKAGRSGEAKVSRVVYGGEGITSFPGTPLIGNVFVRGNSILWSSDLDTARRAVDLVVAREKATAAPAPPALMSLLPDSGAHTLVGVIRGEGGTAERCLALLPGTEMDLPESSLSGADLTFQFDAMSGDAAKGEIVMRFPPETAGAAIATAAGDFSRRITALKWGKVSMTATPRVEASTAVIDVDATGLSTVYARLLQEMVGMQKSLDRARAGQEEPPAPPADPNQSSSTFQ